MIRNKKNWDEYIPSTLLAYRSSINETTLKTPFELLYSREPRLPNDMEKLKLTELMAIDLKKEWVSAKERIKTVNYQFKF